MPQFHPTYGNSRRVGSRSASAVTTDPAGLRVGLMPGHGEVIVEVAGDVTERSAPHLLSTLTRTIFQEPRVCLDLSAVGFFGATGADVLAIAHLTAGVARGRLTVRGVHGSVAQVLEATCLDRILDIVE